MRDTDKKKTIKKSYPKTAKKSSKKSNSNRSKAALNATRFREERREKALHSVAMSDLFNHLELQEKDGIKCPFCKNLNTIKADQKYSFSCSSCKESGNCGKLVRKALGITTWKAIAFIEELAVKLEKENEAARESSESKKTQEISRPEEIPSRKKPLEKPQQTKPCAKSLELPDYTPSYEEKFKGRIHRIKGIHRIEDVIADMAQVAFKRVGQNLRCRCPFPDHEDKTPSFTVTPNKQLYHCFGCKRTGDVISFVEQYKGCSFSDALEILDPGGGESLPQRSLDVTEASTSLARHHQLKKHCQKFFHERLLESNIAQEFLKERELYDRELVEYFKLGFDDGKINQAMNVEVRKDLNEMGFLSEKGCCRFYQCLTAPLEDKEGNISSIYGRRIKTDKGSKHQFPKGNLNGILNAKAFKSARELVITEGVLDAFSVWRMGKRHVTCVFSASFIPQLLIDLIKENQIKKIYLAVDNDKEGDKSALSLAEKLKGIEVLRVQFPDGVKDANELLVQLGKEKAGACFEQLLLQAKPLVGKVASAKNETVNPIDIPIESGKEQIEIRMEDRCYRIRGLAKNLSFDSLRVNIRVFLADRFHVDSFDLYNARQRAAFVKIAATELGIKSEIIKCDVGRILLKLEEFQQQQINEALTPKKKEVILTYEEREEALSLLKAPNLLQKIKVDFTRCGLVGEETNSLVCFLALVSRKLDDPLAVIIQALSAAGKTALMNAALSFMPPEDVVKFTAMTGQSLFYLGEEDLVHKILAISEEEGAEKASYAIKLLQSEKSLTIASTGKDPKTGRFTTHEYTVKGPVQIILTTTAIIIDEELQNRCLVLTVSENELQTIAIHKKQRLKETLKGLLGEREREHIIKLHQNAQRLIRPLMVVNPYAEKLTFLSSRLRTRRDHIKYLTLIRTIALLHQHQRPIKKIKHRQEIVEYIEVTPDDISMANELMGEIMGITLDELAPQTRRFLSLLTKMVEEGCEKDNMKTSQYLFSRKMIRDYSGWSDTQVRTHLDRLVEMEYIFVRSGNRGSRYLYELAYQGEGKDGEKFLPGLMDVQALKNQQGEYQNHKVAD